MTKGQTCIQDQDREDTSHNVSIHLNKSMSVWGGAANNSTKYRGIKTLSEQQKKPKKQKTKKNQTNT